MNTSCQEYNDTAFTNATVRTHKSGKGTVSHLILTNQLMTSAGLKDGNRVKVRLVKIAGPKGSCQLAIEISLDASGVVISARRHIFLLQKMNLFPKKFPTTMMTAIKASKGRLLLSPMFPANDNCLKAVASRCPEVSISTVLFMPPELLESLTIDPGWLPRKKMLGTRIAVRTTPAGDQCYTARFIIDRVLRAAGRSEFDIDVCSMQADGRYDLTIPIITERKWGKVPEEFRRDEEVIRPVPAKRYFTNDRPYGSLGRIWDGELVWLNPPYSLRSWCTFLECAHHQVDKGHAGIIIALVPCDNSGVHNRHLYSENAYHIEITRHIPFFKREKRDKDNELTAQNVIDPIQGNQFVVFGKGPKVKTFLRRFLKELRAIDYISEQHEARYRVMFELNTNRRSRKMAA